jgi:hypothetical protein
MNDKPIAHVKQNNDGTWNALSPRTISREACYPKGLTSQQSI